MDVCGGAGSQLGSGLVVFAGLLQQFTGQVMANLSTIAEFCAAESDRRRGGVFEVLDTPVEVENKAGGRSRPARLTGSVAFDQVTFGYDPGVPVLRDVAFEVKPGQVIGIFGMTGAGKTSLLSLIPRFYDPQRGRVLVDGMDVRDLDLDEFRRQIGICISRRAFCFQNTVAANIAFRESARDDGGDRAGGEGGVRARVHHGDGEGVSDGAGGIGG